MDTWVSGAFGLGGAVLGAIITLFGQWLTEHDKYLYATFEKRLEAIQGTSSRIMAITVSLTPEALILPERRAEIEQKRTDLLHWVIEHNLFIHIKLMKEITTWLLECQQYAAFVNDNNIDGQAKLEKGLKLTEGAVMHPIKSSPQIV
jgi:hypothetical protein